MTVPFYIAGPTASGKTAFAVELARLTGGEIVNADAFQLYRGLPILTAVPNQDERQGIPHHLFEILDPAETCNAGRYLDLARPGLRNIASQGTLPIVVGGSGLYLKALTHGFADTPAASPELRAELDTLTLDQLLAFLRTEDPESARTIDPKNRRYVQRAVEITRSTGRPASEQRSAWASDPDDLHGVVLTWPRQTLVRRIEARIDAMLAGGAIDEVAAIENWSDTSRKAIGVLQIQAYLRGECSLDQTAEAMRIATRRYAKRQTTWFRGETWLTPVHMDSNDASPARVAERLGLS